MSSYIFQVFLGVCFETKNFGKYSRHYFYIVNLTEFSFCDFFPNFYNTELQKKKKQKKKKKKKKKKTPFYE
jgi:hypothetical protein